MNSIEIQGADLIDITEDTAIFMWEGEIYKVGFKSNPVEFEKLKKIFNESQNLSDNSKT